MFSAISSGSAVVVSSGLLAWQVYQNQAGQAAVAEQQDRLNSQQRHLYELEELNKVKYVPVKLAGELQQRLSGQFDAELGGSYDSKEELASFLPRHLRKPWRLLHQANTGQYEQHIKAVAELAKLSLTDSEYCQLAQSCEVRTAVGLARCDQVDLRFFLPPPALPPACRDRELTELFREVLERLPADSADLHECIKFFTSSALDHHQHTNEEEVFDLDMDLEFHRESHHIHSIPRPRVSQETLIEHCLQALLSHSTVAEQCSVLMESLTLPILTRVCQAYPDNARIKSLIGKILSNISMHPAHHRAIFLSGWVGVLAAWKQSPNLLVSLPATKALCNLDQEFGGHKFEPGIYLLLPNDRHVQHKNNMSNWGVDVVFIHGLMGGVFYTWRQADPHNEREGVEEQVSGDGYSYCWPRDWLAEDSQHVRVLGCDFDSYLSQWGGNCPSQSFKQSLADRSSDMMRKLRQAGVGNRPVIFVGHSMGGLIVKQMLAASAESADPELQQLSNNTKGVVFYSTPHEGSEIANMNSIFKYFFFPSVEVQELETNNPQLTSLNQSFKEFVAKNKTKVVSFGETQPTPHLGIDLTFVPPSSSNPGVGDFYSIPVNHINICKPDSRRSILFRKFYNLVWDAVDESCPVQA